MFFEKKEKKGISADGMAAVINANAASLSVLVNRISGEELFGYVDDMLKIIGPACDERNGQLVSISDNGVTAVFAGSCEDALMSSITICQRIASNPNANFDFTAFAVGISYGAVYSNDVGYGSYRFPLTISECTKMAHELHSIAGKYNAHILITENAASQIPDFFQKFNTRCLGSILFRDTGEEMPFYDVFDGDPIETKNSKRRSKLFFETGVKLFAEQEYEKARSYFIELIKSDKNDRAAKKYLEICDRIRNGECAAVKNIEIW